jgi:HIP---CoA ligase
MVTTTAVLLEKARARPDTLAVVDGVTSLTFAQLAELVLDVAGGLMARGVTSGDRVAIWAENRYEWIVSALALQAAGGCLVPLNTRFKTAEAVDLLRRTRTAIVITSSGFLGDDYGACLAEAASELPDVRHIVSFDPSSDARAAPWSDLRGAGVSAKEVLDRAGTVRDDDPCDIMFTSGTTGVPKGAVCTHGTVLRAYRNFCDVVGYRDDDRYLILNPFFHSFGYKAGWLSCILTGATAYPAAVFDTAKVLELIRAHRITVFPGPPTVYWSMMESGLVRRDDISSLRLSITGSTNVPGELIRRMRAELTFEHILVGFGLTEANGLGTMCRPGDSDEVVTTTSGRPLPGMDLRIAEDGEICLRGYLMSHYLDDPEATAAAIDSAGWLHTGDIGALDAAGNLHVTDRKKDMYIIGGFNVYPAEVEGVMLRHPSIAQVAVVGAPDDRMGEVGFAFVVPKRGAVAEEAEILAWCREQMANYKTPRYVRICDQLPLTANGKVLKTELRALARADVLTAGLSHLPLGLALFRERSRAFQRVLGPPQRESEHLRELPVLGDGHVAAVPDDPLEELHGQRRVLQDLTGHLVRGRLQRGPVLVKLLHEADLVGPLGVDRIAHKLDPQRLAQRDHPRQVDERRTGEQMPLRLWHGECRLSRRQADIAVKRDLHAACHAVSVDCRDHRLGAVVDLVEPRHVTFPGHRRARADRRLRRVRAGRHLLQVPTSRERPAARSGQDDHEDVRVGVGLPERLSQRAP